MATPCQESYMHTYIHTYICLLHRTGTEVWKNDRIISALRNVPGHTQVVVRWLTKPHYTVVNGQGLCIGGVHLTERVKQRALDHMESYVCLARSVLEAEFQKFLVICAFTVFALPKSRRLPAVELTQEPKA